MNFHLALQLGWSIIYINIIYSPGLLFNQLALKSAKKLMVFCLCIRLLDKPICLTKICGKFPGHWRLLEFDFLTKVLGHIISLSEENDWLSDGAPAEDYCVELEPLFPRYIYLYIQVFCRRCFSFTDLFDLVLMPYLSVSWFT